MTLVVAGVYEDGVRMVADSRRTMSRSGKKTDLIEGALKLVILRRDAVVGLAGDIDSAVKAIRSEAAAPDSAFDIDRVLDRLSIATTRADFKLLVGRSSPPELWHVSAGRRERIERTWGWAGDRAAFSSFQDAYHSAPTIPGAGSAGQQDGGRMSLAMSQVIESGEHPTVGPPVVAVFPDTNGLIYATSVVAAPGGTQTIPSHEWTTLSLGKGAEDGSLTQFVLTSNQPGIGAVGIYVREARTGTLHHPMQFDQPLVRRDCEHEEFADWIEAQFGLRLRSPTLR